MTIAIRFHKKEKQTGSGDSDADVDLTFDVVPTGRYRKYTRVGGWDLSNDFTQITLIVTSGGVEHAQSAQATCSEDLLYWDPYEITATEGEQLIVRFTGTTDSDSLEAFASYFEGPIGDI
jgi:hypothetical protein